MRMRLLISHQLILIQILLLVHSPALHAEDEDDVDEDYNGGDADDTYTLSQESNEDVLVMPAKSKEQEAKEKKKKKFLEVLSYFSNLLTDEKYKEFQMPGEAGLLDKIDGVGNKTQVKLVRFLKENMEVRTMAKDLIRNELPKILNSFGVDTSINSSNVTLPVNQTAVNENASMQGTTVRNQTTIPVQNPSKTQDIPKIVNKSSVVKNLSARSTTKIQVVPKQKNETKLSPSAVSLTSVAPPQAKVKPTSSAVLTAQAVKEVFPLRKDSLDAEKETLSPVRETPEEGLPLPKASVKESPASPVLVSQAVKETPSSAVSPVLASSPTQETPIPGPGLRSTTVPQMKINSAPAAPQPKSISATVPIAALASAALPINPPKTSKPVLHPVGAKPAFQPPVSSYKSAGTILAAPSLASPRSKRSAEDSEDLYDFDPLKDLENSKQNLKRYIFDENKNDINLLHDLEEKLKTGEGFQPNEDYFLSSDPVKESPSSPSEGLKETIKESPEGDQLAKVLKSIILEAEKVNIEDAKKIAQRAVMELVNAGEKKLRRRKRSIPKNSNLHKVESKALSHILKEVYELQDLIKTNNEHSSEDGSGSRYHIETEKKEASTEGASIESSLLDHVTTLLSRSAVEQMLGGAPARSTSFTKVLEENMKKTLLDDIVAHIAESVVDQFVSSRKGKDGSQEQERGRKPVSIEVLDDYQLDGQAVHQQEASFRISESDPLGEFSMFRVFRADPGSEHTFRSSSEESGEDLSPLLSKVSRKDLRPERVLEEKGIQSFRVEGDKQGLDDPDSSEDNVYDAAKTTENGHISKSFDTFTV